MLLPARKVKIDLAYLTEATYLILVRIRVSEHFKFSFNSGGSNFEYINSIFCKLDHFSAYGKIVLTIEMVWFIKRVK
jgi:hypothetical protein